jgi:two-component system OmpR family response regulator
MASNQPSILLIDDDAALSAMVREYLEAEGFEVEMRGNGVAGLERALKGGLDAVILDVMMPEMNGIEVLRRLRQHSEVPVLMLTAKGDQIDRVLGLELGADDYIAKPYYPRELVARLRAVLRRGPSVPPPTACFTLLDLQVQPSARRAAWQGHEIDLTATEFAILDALIRACDDVSTKNDLSLHALGRRREAYDRSVDVHVSNLRLKLQTATCGQIAIETIRGVGYRLQALSEAPVL